MAVFTRINGDAAGVVNVDAGRYFANTKIINTGIAAPLTAYVIGFPKTGTGITGNLAAELTTGGAIETTLRIISGNATVLAYQVDPVPGATTSSQLSVICERSGWASDTILQNAIQQTGAGDGAGNIGATANVYAVSATVTSAYGLKLASS
jgi:hypothetical protein